MSARVGEWIALVAGFVGMLLIVQLVSDQFDPASLIAVAAAIVLSARDLAVGALDAAENR